MVVDELKVIHNQDEVVMTREEYQLLWFLQVELYRFYENEAKITGKNFRKLVRIVKDKSWH